MAGRTYSRKDNPVTSDLCMIWDSEASDWRLTTISALTTLIESNLGTTIQEPITQYSVPVTGFSVQVNDSDSDVHLILSPAGTLATGTIVLPTSTNLRDKQVIMVNSTNEVTALTVDANGATFPGSPTTITANGYFSMKYDYTGNVWYRIA